MTFRWNNIRILFLFSLVLPEYLYSYDENWYKKVSKNYSGITLNGIAENYASTEYIDRNIGNEFHRLTGIHIDIETASWETMYQKSIKDIVHKSGIYDFIYIEQDMVYSFLKNNYLVNISQWLSNHKNLRSPGFNFNHFTSFLSYYKNDSQQVFGIPIDAYLKLYFYRKDLFSNEKYQKMYQKKYKKKLFPAKNFEDYRNISEFFTEIGRLEHRPLWGTTFQGGSEFSASFYEFFETIAPAFGLYHWGIENKKASVSKGGMMDSDLAIKALEYWISLKQFAPPESAISTWDTTAESMGMGRVAQGMIYGENAIWLSTDATRSKVSGNIGVTLPPTIPSAFEMAKNGKGYIGYYDGGAFCIPVTSKKIEATLLWIQFLGDHQIQEKKSIATGAIVHKSTLISDSIKTFDLKTGGYFSTFLEYEHLFSGAPKLPDHMNIRDIVSKYISEAITGTKPPGEALKNAANSVDQYFLKN